MVDDGRLVFKSVFLMFKALNRLSCSWLVLDVGMYFLI